MALMDQTAAWGFFRPLLWEHIAVVVAVFLVARAAAFAARAGLRRAAERARPQWRLTILRLIPLSRLALAVLAVIVAVPILVEPTLRNVVALAASVGLGLAFALKDYASSLVASIVTVVENAYQPGDWITLDGVYGEVKVIDARAVRLVTADDTEVIIPHDKLWTNQVANATSGKRSLLCVVDFYLHADHDGAAVVRQLTAVAMASAFRLADTAVKVTAQEKPWGTQYKLKSYVREAREQFDFITDLTVRGKAALLGLGIRFAQAPYAATRQN